MSEEFKIEIVNPEKSFLSKENVKEVVLPAFEGEMGILKDHISIISFLKPGIIKVYSKSEENKYFVEDGIVEYFDNSLVVLSVSAINLKDLSKEFLDNLSKDTQDKLVQKDISDHERYMLNHKLDALKEIRV